MKINFFKDTDSMYIEFSDKPAKQTVAVSDSVNIDLDENKELVGVDIHSNASKFNFDELEFKNVPKIKNISFK